MSRKLPVILALLVAACGTAAAEPALFESRRLTPVGEYPSGIEGPAVDAAGNLFVVNFRRKGTIGVVAPGAARSALFAELPPGSVGNGIRFDRDGRMYVADYKQHNVLVFERGQNVPQVYFHSDRFHQPNDLAMAADGTIYASDPHGSRRPGQVWRIARGPDGKGRGEVMTSDRPMGMTNGIELGPDEATLYVGWSATCEVWAYRPQGAKLVEPRLVKKFEACELDGMRVDIDGRLHVTRIPKRPDRPGVVVVLRPDGTVEREVRLLGREPTNLAFGGPDGKTVFVTQSQGGFIEAFRVDRPGREYCLQRPAGIC